MQRSMEKVTFTRIDTADPEEIRRVGRFDDETAHLHVADNVLAELRRLRQVPLIIQVDELGHSLQTATRAYRDGADEETVVSALVHDIGETLSPRNHSDFAAAILRPYVSEANFWMVQHHALFQGYYFWHHLGRDRNGREKYRGHPHFERTALFCEQWDVLSFDPNYDTMPLEAFEPMVRRIFARPPYEGNEYN